ncbi:hypothetical protein BDZ88DRAFT_57854 [Geranomyces variabilis]|nr:hypothetical protein BDZ88DRAFT_57854 [Geranomyces variabilis]
MNVTSRLFQFQQALYVLQSHSQRTFFDSLSPRGPRHPVPSSCFSGHSLTGAIFVRQRSSHRIHQPPRCLGLWWSTVQRRLRPPRSIQNLDAAKGVVARALSNEVSSSSDSATSPRDRLPRFPHNVLSVKRVLLPCLRSHFIVYVGSLAQHNASSALSRRDLILFIRAHVKRAPVYRSAQIRAYDFCKVAVYDFFLFWLHYFGVGRRGDCTVDPHGR